MPDIRGGVIQRGKDLMKVVILAGGRGTRISEESDAKPKPMIEVGGQPILWHIMRHYATCGFTEFIVCGGYKYEMIEEWAGRQTRWKIDVVNTGQETLTGGRLKQIAPLIDDTFFMTYGDGVCGVDLEKLLAKHRYHRKLVTVTAVHFAGRFGVMYMDNKERVTGFLEKAHDWINGGFFVMEPDALDFIEKDEPWEQRPMKALVEDRQLIAYKHYGFWQCMDTLRDKQLLEGMWNGTEFMQGQKS